MQIIKHPKKSTVRIIAVVALLLLGLGYLLNFFIGGQVRIGNSAIKKYYGGYYDIMPFAERGNPQKEFNYFYQKNMVVFTSVSSVLIAEYSDDEFKLQKKYLESREQIDRRIGENWSNESFSINSCIFIVDAESKPANTLTIFGFDEKKNRIAYIKFRNRDLDDISDTPREFFNTYIKYIFI